MDTVGHRGQSQRRAFLKQTGFGLAALTIGGCLPGGSATVEDLPPGIAGRLKFASPTEFLVLRAAAEQLIDLPAEGGPLPSHEVAVRMDNYLAGADPEVQDQFHQLLTVFNSGITAFLFDFRASSYLGMSPEERSSYLRDWMESPIGFRRTAFTALKRVAMSTYYSHPSSWAPIGFDGDHSPRVSS